MIKRKCLICSNKFNTYRSRINIGKGNFCSRVCASTERIGKAPWNKGLRGDPRNKGFTKKHTEETKEKISKLLKGKTPWNKGTNGIMKAWNKGLKVPQITGINNPNWKGDKANYYSIHSWVYRHKGKALVCELCGKSSENPRKIQWSNKDHKYLRNLDDWVSLCIRCHRKHDSKLRLNNS